MIAELENLKTDFDIIGGVMKNTYPIKRLGYKPTGGARVGIVYFAQLPTGEFLENQFRCPRIVDYKQWYTPDEHRLADLEAFASQCDATIFGEESEYLSL